MSDGGLATEYGAAGVDDDIVLDGGVALAVAAAFLHCECAEGDALIDLHVGADHGSLADHDTCTMIDKE